MCSATAHLLGGAGAPRLPLWHVVCHSLAEPNFRKTVTTPARYSSKVLILLNWKLILRLTCLVKMQGEMNYAKPNVVCPSAAPASSSFPKNRHRKLQNGIKVKGKTQPRDKVFYEIQNDSQKLISL